MKKYKGVQRTTGRFRVTTALFAALLAITAQSGLAADQKAADPNKEKPRGDLDVIVAVEGGKPFKNCTLYVKDQQLPVGKAGETIYVKGVLAGRVAVTVEARVAEGAVERRYLGVTESAVVAGQKSKASVMAKPVSDIDAFCLSCHPDARDPKVKVQPGQIVKDVHASNKVLGEPYLPQLKAYNDTVARLEKEGKPHNFRIPVEERIIKVGGKEVKQIFFTCESCHTLHLTSPGNRYARAPFLIQSELCVGCHF